MDGLRAAVYEIVDSDLPNKMETYQHKYPEFFKSHPRLMNMACESTLSVQTFKTMFEHLCVMKTRIDNDDISRDAAEKIVGQSLADEYLPI